MRQVEKKKGKDKAAAALMLCFCLIALTSIFTIKASIDKISESAGEVPVTKKTAADEKKDQTPAKEEAAAPSQEASAKVPTVDSRREAPKTQAFISPLDMDTASISKHYSMDMVVYNLTLDQYMTHPGIDLTAPAGSGVKAVSDGTITDIYEDDAYGTTIEITHEGGLVSRYCNLSTDRLAEKGDTVKQGQVISNIGKTALYESMEKAHLHFEMVKDGKPVDPGNYISF